MVKNGHAHESAATIPELPYAPGPGAPAAGMEIMTLSDLRSRAEAHGQRLASPQRPGFHQLFAVETGTLRQSVDFTEHATPAGAWLWVRPGQVQQYGGLEGTEGTLVLFQPAFPDPATAAAVGLDEASGALMHHPVGERARAARLALDHLRFEFAAAHSAHADRPPAPHVEVLRHLLAALLLRLVRLAGPDGMDGADGTGRADGGGGRGSADRGAEGGPAETFRRFRAAVERDFTRTRRVSYYARVLGYSPRTLSRATRAVAGLGAKEFVDRRVILEAKRLLAHTDSPSALIATQLGFADATNFTKFFHQRAGTAPGAFRTSVRS
ncbi:helix-turn-helix domain-containing protein [Streptomyces sp. NBC_01795]|uniref:AraC family transcriptional regulator n=1 Tax=Streptomyces sp. NBC_01795 TaxID=2975943 RepID=UPI002DDB4AC3|nr:helix-turn-helix domain-containing protein [Streptomyces sp. NBC_01795]WSA90985.1 helix-turn-helix domain-containing protein [Streptomyces sp. NBC_01795]